MRMLLILNKEIYISKPTGNRLSQRLKKNEKK